MSELISTAPLYTKDRVHLTKLGNILCTGKGCIGCDRNHQIGAEVLSEILGEVDLVDFSKQEPRFLGTGSDIFPCPDHEVKARGRHGNKTSTLTVGTKTKNKKGNFRRKKKFGREAHNVRVTDPRTDSVQKKIKISDSNANDNSSNNHNYEGRLKRAAKSKQGKNNTVSFAVPLVRQRTFTLTEEIRKPEISKVSSERNELKPANLAATRQYRFDARSKTHPLIAERKTNFLEMLQNSNVGIFDIESMRGKKSSKWVKEVLRCGAKKEELFPQIYNKTQKSNQFREKSKAKKNTEKRGARTEDDNRKMIARKMMLPMVSASNRFAHVDSSQSILVIEHSHEKAALNAKDESLHKLAFQAQQGSRTESFPGVSILEIAEGLDNLVQLGAIKLIQEHEGRWYVLVSSRIIRDFLLQTGVTLRGRRFELIDCNGGV